MTRTYEIQKSQRPAIAMALPARWTLSPEKVKWILGAILTVVVIILAVIR